MLTRDKAQIVVLWVAMRLKKLVAAGLIQAMNPSMPLTERGRHRLERYLLEHLPPNEQEVFQCCQFLFNGEGPLSGTARDQVPTLIHLILTWKE